MDADVIHNYRARLRSLDWATQLLRDLRHSLDGEAVSVAAHWALDAVYDLFEAHRLATNLSRKVTVQDELLQQTSGEKLGGLLFVRGEKTHRAMRIDGPSPFRDLPYDFADLTHWVWTDLTTSAPGLENRAVWYRQYVCDRPLWVPLDEALYWFLTKSPLGTTPRQDTISCTDWVRGVRPVYIADEAEVVVTGE